MPAKRVAEAMPTQVYLDGLTRVRLERLASQLDTTKSDVLRRGLLALEREVLDPASHPALRMLGGVAEAPATARYDVAAEHDRYLADVNAVEPLDSSPDDPPPAASPARGRARKRAR
ncbi:MAG: hypothetical protein ABI877_11450 [Gemmatimonadaceae bacterium]